MPGTLLREFLRGVLTWGAGTVFALHSLASVATLYAVHGRARTHGVSRQGRRVEPTKLAPRAAAADCEPSSAYSPAAAECASSSSSAVRVKSTCSY
jgi:hypothetical protein